MFFVCFGSGCILFYIVQTHKKVCSCVKSPRSFFLLSFLLWFLLFFLDIKEMIGFLFVTVNTAQLFANIAKDRPTVCRHCQIWPNLFVIIAKHWPTVCQLYSRPTNSLPTNDTQDINIIPFTGSDLQKWLIIKSTVPKYFLSLRRFLNENMQLLSHANLTTPKSL